MHAEPRSGAYWKQEVFPMRECAMCGWRGDDRAMKTCVSCGMPLCDDCAQRNNSLCDDCAQAEQDK